MPPLRIGLVFFSVAVLGLASEPDPLLHLRPGHPRLLVTDDQLAAARHAALTDPLEQQVQKTIIELAEKELTARPIIHSLIGPRMLDQSRRAISQILTEAMAYRLTGDTRYSDRARRDLLTVAGFADWNPSHYLDVAEMSFAAGVGYDWLYPILPASERTVIKNALMHHSLVFAPEAYGGGKPKDKRLFWVTQSMNWNQVCNAGMLTAALAVADEEPGLARMVIAGVRRSLPLVMAADYLPDGAYPEGPGYWAYGTTYNVIAIAELEETLGSDFGLASAPAFSRTAYYRMMIEGPTGQGFNYADGSASLEPTPAYGWLARRYGPLSVAAHSRAELANELKRRSTSDRFTALNVVWCAPAVAEASAPLDAHFQGRADLALFRSAWGDPNALWIGFKAGNNQVNHSHLDLGSFVLESDGVRWAQDLGPDNYNLPEYFGAKRWSYYRMNNHSHNTVTVGDQLQFYKGVAPIVAYGSTPARAFAVADLTGAYPGRSRSLRRGIALLDRARVLVQDEWTPSEKAAALPLHWGMVTGAEIALADDGRSATLTSKGKALRVELLEPAGARLVSESTRPATAAENQNARTAMLATSLPVGAGGGRLVVLLTPVGGNWLPLPKPAILPLDRWQP